LFRDRPGYGDPDEKGLDRGGYVESLRDAGDQQNGP
jgi:hypothetical protein